MRDTVLKQQAEELAEIIELKEPVESEVPIETVELVDPKESVEPVSEHGAVSVGSPTQAAAEGALMQWRNLNFLPLDQVGSHSDHWLHSAQVPAGPEEKEVQGGILQFILGLKSLSIRNRLPQKSPGFVVF